MAAEDHEVSVPKFSLTDLGLNYISDMEMPKTINPRFCVKYDWQLTSFLLEITVQENEHVSRHIVTICTLKGLFYISVKTLVDIVFQTCGRSQRLKMMELVEERYKENKSGFMHEEMKMMEIHTLSSLMQRFAGTDKRVSKYVVHNSFYRTCDPVILNLFFQKHVQTAIDGALESMIKHVSWQWPYYENPTSESSQRKALEDIEDIERAIIDVTRSGKYQVKLDKSCLGDFIKRIATFYNNFPVFTA
jgi:hypothetical protein